MIAIKFTNSAFSNNYIFETITLMQFSVQRTEKNSKVVFQFQNKQDLARLIATLRVLEAMIQWDNPNFERSLKYELVQD